MFGKAAPWMVYQKEMSACDLGIPLWEPNPPYLLEGPRYKRMEVGDVGVLQGGSFELLFNVFLEKDHPRQGHFGVPQDFKPLRLPGPRGHNTEELFAIAAPLRGALDAMPLKTENVIYHRGSLHGGATPGPVPFNVGAKFEFEFSKESGAVLLFSKPARRYEMGQGDLLEQHVRLNYRSWMGFARDQGYSLYFGQLYIVTGVIRTSQWAMATWKSSSKSFDSKASLSVAGVADTSAAYKGHWSTPNQTIMTNQGPVIDTLGGTDNQTLFFNTIVVRGRGLFPAKIRAAAGPRDLGAGDRDANSAPEVPMQMDEEEDAEIFRIPGNTKDSDVLAPVLDHILDLCPDAEAALARDSDLMPYLSGKYDVAAIKKRMQLFAPEVTVTDGVGSLSHQPYSVMLRKLANEMIVDGDEEPLASQDLLTLVARIPPLAELVPGNKLGARQLSEWCCEFAFFVRQYPSGLSDAIAEATRIVRSIENDMENWTHKLPRAIAIIQRRDIESTLQQHHIKIHQVCRRWQVRTHSRIEDMDMGIVQMTLRRGLYDEDHVSTMEELSDGPSFDALVDELATEDSQGRFPEALQGLAEVMQEGLGVFSRGDAKRRSLEVNLYGLLQRARGLLPDLELRRGEVNRLDANAFNGTAKYDEYKGRYLSSEEVVIKFFRTYMPSTSGNVTSPDKHQRRFVREAGIWLATWQQDRGKYLVPFYGYCITDTRGPYMVSPYYPQTAENYVKQVIGIDHLGLLRDVAKGLEVLHGMDPQVIHGSVKGSNIFIGRDGTARLGNFGFSKLMEDVMGEPYTATGNAEAEVRWRPPERWQGQGILSVEGDIWEFGMTMLELLTHERPWKEYRHVGQVLSAISAGRRPVRPSDPEVVARGLTDNIWALMEACWKEERDERPKIAEVLRALPAPSGPGDVIMA